MLWQWLHHVGNQKYFCLRHHGKLSRNQFSCIRYITWMPHIPFGNSLKYCKLLDKGTPNSLDLAQHSPGLNLDLHSWPAAPSTGKEASLLPLSSLLPPDRRRIGLLLLAGEGVLFWNNTLCTGSSAGPALLHPPGKISLLESCSSGIKTHHKIQPILPGFPLRRKPRKQRVPAVLKHFSACLRCNIAAFLFFYISKLLSF